MFTISTSTTTYSNSNSNSTTTVCTTNKKKRNNNIHNNSINNRGRIIRKDICFTRKASSSLLSSLLIASTSPIISTDIILHNHHFPNIVSLRTIPSISTSTTSTLSSTILIIVVTLLLRTFLSFVPSRIIPPTPQTRKKSIASINRLRGGVIRSGDNINTNNFNSKIMIQTSIQNGLSKIEPLARKIQNLLYEIKTLYEKIDPKILSLTCMTIAMSFLFFGYEFARAGNLSLFISKDTGFSGSSAFPMAMACVSPFSFLLVLGYTQQLALNGPRIALRHTTLFTTIFTFLSGLLISLPLSSTTPSTKLTTTSTILQKTIIWISFVFQNSYVHLLYTQHWSFLSSIVTPNQGASYFAIIAGISSVAATIAGGIIPFVVKIMDDISWLNTGIGNGGGGAKGLALISGCSLLVTLFMSDLAYSIANRHGFDPIHHSNGKDKNNNDHTTSATNKKKSSNDNKQQQKKTNLITKINTIPNKLQNTMNTYSKTTIHTINQARRLFHRVPVLGALLMEVLTFQTLSTLLNTCLLRKMQDVNWTNDSERATWNGKFYGLINGSSAALQFLVLPFILKKVSPGWIWKFVPLVPTACVLLVSFQSMYTTTNSKESLFLIATCLFVVKSVDYSVRNVVNELVYVPLDFESRYLGKEIIGVFGTRLGKSGISLFLSLLPFLIGDIGVPSLIRMSVVASFLWIASAHRLGQLVPNVLPSVSSASTLSSSTATSTTMTEKEKRK